MKKRTIEKTLELEEINSLNGFTICKDQEGIYHIYTPSGKWFYTNQGDSKFMEVNFFDKGFNVKSSEDNSQVFLFESQNWWVGPSGKSIFKEVQMHKSATILKNDDSDYFKIVLNEESDYWKSPDGKDSFINVIAHPRCLIIQTSKDVWRVYDISQKDWIKNNERTAFASVGYVDSTSISIQNTRGRKVDVFKFDTSK